jgi:hypothetical protein
MRSLGALCLGLVFLASCGPSRQEVARQQYQAVLAQYQTLRGNCVAQYPDQPPTIAALQKCKNDAYEETMIQFDTYQDLSELVETGDLEISDQADAGKITVDQANFEKAQLLEQVSQIVQARNNQNAEAAAQRLSALSNYLSASRALIPPPPQPYNIPVQPTVVTNCTGFANQVNCVSH